MVVPFENVFQVPAAGLKIRVARLRRGRLNEVADEHFRESIAQYFRRYPVDEWYPLNKEEFDKYVKDETKSSTPPMPWQKPPLPNGDADLAQSNFSEMGSE
jgi:hypothetical protein